MKTKILVLICILILHLSNVKAQYIVPLDCNKLFNKSTFESKTEFNFDESICFYGSGFSSESISVKLNGTKDYKVNAETSNHVISSVLGIKKFFTNVASGIYRLIITDNEQNYEYPESIIVNEQDNDGSQYDKDEIYEEVPEFSTFTYLAVLAGTGYFLLSRRGR